jgi:hypothetical protein
MGCTGNLEVVVLQVFPDILSMDPLQSLHSIDVVACDRVQNKLRLLRKILHKDQCIYCFVHKPSNLDSLDRSNILVYNSVELQSFQHCKNKQPCPIERDILSEVHKEMARRVQV